MLGEILTLWFMLDVRPRTRKDSNRAPPTRKGSAVACVLSSIVSRAAYSSTFSLLDEDPCWSRRGMPSNISLFTLKSLCGKEQKRTRMKMLMRTLIERVGCRKIALETKVHTIDV